MAAHQRYIQLLDLAECGEVNHTVASSNFVVCYPLNLHVNVKGTNGQYYYKTRSESSGSWSSSWQLGVPCFA